MAQRLVWSPVDNVVVVEMHQTQGDLRGVELTLARTELASLHQVEHQVPARQILHHEEQLLLALKKTKHYSMILLV